MTAEEKVLGYLGLAARAGKLVSGEFSCEKAVKGGTAALVILAGDASDNTKKKFSNMCVHYGVALYEMRDRETLGAAIGKSFRASCAVTDAGLARAISRVLAP